MNDEREIIACIRRCCDGDGSMSDRIIKELEECARTDESTFLTTIQLMTASGGYIQVKFLVPKCTLEEYHDFFIDDEGLGDVIVYARKKHECLEKPNMIYSYRSHKIPNKKEIEELKKSITEAGSGFLDCRLTPIYDEKVSEIIKNTVEKKKEEIAAYNSDEYLRDAFKTMCESFARIGATKAEASDINNDEKDFEYICDRCGVRVKTPNTLRGPVNVVDFYREVEDEVGDSVSYRLCQECMRDFFGFLSCN